MKGSLTDRGFEVINFTDSGGNECSLQASSMIDMNDPKGLDRQPGTSFLWLGINRFERMHLDRDQVRRLATAMDNWLKHGTFGGNLS
jgi:hypothetical protein